MVVKFTGLATDVPSGLRVSVISDGSQTILSPVRIRAFESLVSDDDQIISVISFYLVF